MPQQKLHWSRVQSMKRIMMNWLWRSIENGVTTYCLKAVGINFGSKQIITVEAEKTVNGAESMKVSFPDAI